MQTAFLILLTGKNPLFIKKFSIFEKNKTMENNQTVPELQPETGSVYSYGWKVIKQNFLPLLVVIIVVMVAEGIVSFKGRDYAHDYTFSDGALSFLLGILVAGPISFSAKQIFLKAVRGEKFDIKEVFSCFGPRYLDIMMANLIIRVIIIVGLILFIIPGIIFAVRLSFVPFLVTDKEMNATEAIQTSWKMTKEYAWDIFFIGVVAFFLMILGIILLIVGIFPALMLIEAAVASMYYVADQRGPRVISV